MVAAARAGRPRAAYKTILDVTSVARAEYLAEIEAKVSLLKSDSEL